MSHKIAIISIRKVPYAYYDSYGDNYGDVLVANSITEWEEVTDEEYELLLRAEQHHGTFKVIEQVVNQKEFIAKTVSDYKKLLAAEEARLADEKRKKEEAALQRKFKKELKDKESKQKMLEKLASELGVEVVTTK